VAERVAGAIEDRLGRPVEPQVEQTDDERGTDSSTQLIIVRLVHDQCTLSVDSSGALLHRRGYRLATAKAPLRETLAAGVLMASGWDLAAPLLDPFCGSGTICIEAALMARGLAPGRARRFNFMDWTGFNASLWQSLLAQAGATSTSARPRLLASDRNAGAIQAARANADRAGVAHDIEFVTRAISAIEPPPTPGWIITNPPYGVRVSQNTDLRNLYARFGQVVRARCTGWHLAMLCDRMQLARQTGLDFDRGLPLMNGGLKVKLLRARL
jgi:putative N6-adenine-specific DNA methylase